MTVRVFGTMVKGRLLDPSGLESVELAVTT
jgi:hypothetical protein